MSEETQIKMDLLDLRRDVDKLNVKVEMVSLQSSIPGQSELMARMDDPVYKIAYRNTLAKIKQLKEQLKNLESE